MFLSFRLHCEMRLIGAHCKYNRKATSLSYCCCDLYVQHHLAGTRTRMNCPDSIILMYANLWSKSFAFEISCIPFTSTNQLSRNSWPNPIPPKENNLSDVSLNMERYTIYAIPDISLHSNSEQSYKLPRTHSSFIPYKTNTIK